MLSDYSEGSGSALEEANKSATNLEGSLNSLHNTWTSVVNNVLNSDTLKSGVNILDNILGLVNDLTNALGTVGTGGLIAGITAFVKGFD